MQSRFLKQSKRLMTNIDFNSWVGVRTLGEAITRTKSLDPKILLETIMDEKFQKIDPHQPYCTCVSCQDYRLNKKASNNKTLFVYKSKH